MSNTQLEINYVEYELASLKRSIAKYMREANYLDTLIDQLSLEVSHKEDLLLQLQHELSQEQDS